MTTKEFDILQKSLYESVLDDLTADDLSIGQAAAKRISDNTNISKPNRMLSIQIGFSQDIAKINCLSDFNFLREILQTESCVQRMGCLGDNVSDVQCRIVFSDSYQSDNTIYHFEGDDLQSAKDMSKKIQEYAVICADKHLPGWENRSVDDL